MRQAGREMVEIREAASEVMQRGGGEGVRQPEVKQEDVWDLKVIRERREVRLTLG